MGAPGAGGSTARLGRRYARLALVLTLQIVLVALFPSTPVATGDRTPSVHSAHLPEDAGALTPADSAGVDRRVGAPTTVDGGANEPSSSSPATFAPTTPAVGDMTHCVSGRQFDPRIDPYAPACRPRSAGTNPGATTRGVTSEEILLIDYFLDPGPGPSAVFSAQEIGATREQQAQFDAAAETFINRHFDLHGRKVRIELWPSPCTVQPPDESCLRADAAQVVIDKKPFAVVNSYVTPMSFFFDELSQRHTVNVGGWQMRDEFSAARRPYHWDPNISGTRMARIFSEWYCKQLHGRPVAYAGIPRSPQPTFNGRDRVLGVVALDDPENVAIISEVLRPALKRCGASVAHTVLIEPNLARAGIQTRAAIATLREEPEATVVLCICGPAMAVLHAQMQEENYYPEHLMPGNSMTDLDSVAQYFTGPLGCPSQSNCQAENMFGFAQAGPQEPRFRGVGSRIWRAAGNAGDPPYPRVDVDWTYWSLLATLIEEAGPNLTPDALERAAVTVAGFGGGTSGRPFRAFRGDSHGWVRDLRLVYWSTERRSPYNGAPGTWVQVGKDRVDLGAVPSGELILPSKPR